MNSTDTLPLSPPSPTEDAQETETAAPVFQFSEEDLKLLLAELPASARGREADCLAWWRAFPQLLAEGQQGRFALIHEGKFVSVWDTHADTIQAGYDKFGIDARIFVGPIKQRELDNWKKFLAQFRAKQCPT